MSVIIYTTPTCPFCTHAKDYFEDNKIEFEEKDVSKNKEAAKEMIEKTGQMGVPVIDIDGEIMIGFDKDAIKKALESSEDQ